MNDTNTMRNQGDARSDGTTGCEGWDSSQFTEALARLSGQKQSPAVFRRQQLSEIIETRIIPQLRLAYRSGSTVTEDVAIPDIAERIGEFADLVIKHDAQVSAGYFQNLLTRGASVGYLFRELIGPTAQRLGELWDEDINTMMDVTQGLAHLQQIVRRFGADYRDENGNALLGRCALLMPLPGEQHTLGITMVEEYFRRAGWQVWGGPPSSMKEIMALVRTMRFDLVAFSASQIHDVKKLAREIKAIRKVSMNKDVSIMVGGLAFNERPELVELIGADRTAIDGPEAVRHATVLVGTAATSQDARQLL